MNIIEILTETKELIQASYQKSAKDVFLLNDFDDKITDRTDMSETQLVLQNYYYQSAIETIQFIKAIRQCENLISELTMLLTDVSSFDKQIYAPYEADYKGDGIKFNPYEQLLVYINVSGGTVTGLPKDIHKYKQLVEILSMLKREGIIALYQCFIDKIEAMCIMEMPLSDIEAAFEI